MTHRRECRFNRIRGPEPLILVLFTGLDRPPHDKG
ncbi:hypothetical protein DO71_6102 [Burkholderia pseudomallei]|nr:hypothetical protein DO71_6102 [Burkholderia pseudomallei]KGD10466.1 hypothetical protein DP42_5416 [Burkholderia pseudomallei]